MRATSHLNTSPHRQARSSLRNEIKRGSSDWTREQWQALYTSLVTSGSTADNSLGARAHSLKRTGDAYLNPAGAKGPLRGRVSEDALRGVLILTDSLCLYLFRNFADERIRNGHVNTKTYRELEGLLAFVRGRWTSLRSNEDHKDMVRGMLGLV